MDSKKYTLPGQPTNDFYTESLSSKSSQNCNFTTKKCVFIFVLGLILIATTCAVVIVFVVKNDFTKDQTGATRMEYVGEITLLEEWDNQLKNKNSTLYKDKVQQIQLQLDVSFKKGRLADYYESVEVIGLRQGSIIIDILVELNVPSGQVDTNTGSVRLTVRGSGSKVEVTQLIAESIGETSSLKIDKEKVAIRASVILKTSAVSTATLEDSIVTQSPPITTTTTIKPTTGPDTPTRTTQTTTRTSTTVTRPTTGPGPLSPETTARTTQTSIAISTTVTKPTTEPGPSSPNTTTTTTPTTTVTSTTVTKPTTGPGPSSPNTTTTTTPTTTVTSTTLTKPTTGPGPPSPDTTAATTPTTTVTSTTVTNPTTGPGPLSPETTARTTQTSVVISTTVTKPTTEPKPLAPDTTAATTPTTTVTSTTVTKPTTGPGPPSPDTTATTTPTTTVTSTTLTKPTTGPGPRSPDTTAATTPTTTVTSTTVTKPTTGPGPLSPETTARTTQTSTITSTTVTKPTTRSGPPSPDTTPALIKESIVFGGLVLDETWSDDLLDDRSNKFLQLAERVGDEILSLMNTTAFADNFSHFAILNFRPGSVLVDFRLTFRNLRIVTETEVPRKGEMTTVEILSALKQSARSFTSNILWETLTISICPTAKTSCAEKTLLGEVVCINTWSLCDGRADCPGNSDELNCDSVNCTFSDANICGYLPLFNTFGWHTRIHNIGVESDRHLEFSTTVSSEAYIASPPMKRSGLRGSLSFHYRKSGVGLGTLSVYIAKGDLPKTLSDFNGEDIWTIAVTGEQNWKNVQIILDETGTNTYHFIIRAYGTSSNVTIGVDNVMYTDMTSGKNPSTTTTEIQSTPSSTIGTEEELNSNISVNCTFEHGTCGYFNSRPHNPNSRWNLSSVDHISGRILGHFMSTTYRAPGTVNLGSPRFKAKSSERCLSMKVFTPTKHFGAILKLFTSVEGVVQPVHQWGAVNFRRDRFLTDSAIISVNLPPQSEQIFYQLKFEFEDSSKIFEYFLAIDDISLSPGPCPQVPVTTYFATVGLSGYQSLYGTNTWRTEFTYGAESTNTDRHIVFVSRNQFGNYLPHLYEYGYISSPVISDSTLKGCLSLRYKFDANFTTTLWVYVVKGELPEKEEAFDGDLIWSLKSSGHQDWRTVSIPLDQSGASSYRIVFKGHGVTDNTDFIRIDSIELSPNACGIPGCSDNEFRCTSTLACVPRSALCNTVQDCSSDDLSDENNPGCDRHIVFVSRNQFGNYLPHLYEYGYISSPVISDSTLKGCLSLRYKFDANFTTTLWVYVVKGELPEKEEAFDGDLIWSLKSSGHQDWRTVSIPLDQSGASSYRIVFKGHGVTDNTDFIRIDSIELSPNACGIPGCSDNEFRCTSTLACVPRSALCNTVQDCSSDDLSDENNPGCEDSISCNFSSSNLCGYQNSTGLSSFWVSAQTNSAIEKTPIRLAGGDTNHSGRVEIFQGGVWGRICSQYIGEEEGQVLCKMLGFQRYDSMDCCGRFGLGTLPKIISGLSCGGDEADLNQCQYNRSPGIRCEFIYVLGVNCSQPKPPTGDASQFGLAPQFFWQNKFSDLANVVSPKLHCFTPPGDCRSACVEIDLQVSVDLKTPFIIYGEDTMGQKTRLWSSSNVETTRTRVTLSDLDNVVRLHFTSYHNSRQFNSVIIHKIDYLETCTSTSGCSSLDSSQYCDSVTDCEDGRDEWGPTCAGLSISCSFEQGLCGYSTNSPSLYWGSSTLDEIKEKIFKYDEYEGVYIPSDIIRGSILYYLSPAVNSEYATDELRFPEIEQLYQGGCLYLHYQTRGNFTLTSPQGHIYRSSKWYSSPWLTARIYIPEGLKSLSFFVDTTRTHLLISEISLTPGQCSSETSVRDCPYGEKFLCGDGNEIDCPQTCDGEVDCSDQSDEIGCGSCGPGMTECPSSGRCISSTNWCDGLETCPNGEDDIPGCGCDEESTYTCTRNGHQSCRSYQLFCYYVPCFSQFCNGYKCDEEQDCCFDCCNSTAMSMCANGKCVNKDKLCDGVNNCGDFTDEMNCPCRSYHHICEGSGVCVNAQAVCDGEANCPGATDEGLQCFNCDEEKEFKCDDGFCVDKEEVCDGRTHCIDGSDEFNCTETCLGWICKQSGKCITQGSRCDGSFDCLTNKVEDLSDETESCTCNRFRKRCNNGACIPTSKWCDRVDDCRDNSDELNCVTCPKGDWACANGHCIREEFRCDGHRDCTDYSDEVNCSECPAGTVSSCGNTRCLSANQICDGKPDCGGQEDELLCGSLKTLTGVSDLVFFNITQQSLPLCADGIGVDVLQEICLYLVNGNYVEHNPLTVQGAPSTSFVKIDHGNKNTTQVITSRLTIGYCASQSMVRLKCQPPSCGKREEFSRASTLIIGGDDSMLGEWPWVGYLTYLGTQRCGVSVINERWVITAGHCVTRDSKYNSRLLEVYLSVVFGSLRLTTLTSGAQQRMVEKLFIHPMYSPLDQLSVGINDVALMKLASPLDLQGSGIRPICLPQQDRHVPTYAVCYVAGWGWSIPGSDSRRFDLFHLRMPIINTPTCQEKWQSVNINGSLLCAGFDSGTSLPCHGDSGGPLMCLDHHGYWTVQGVVSFGQYHCIPRNNRIVPSVFARISIYRHWIDETIRLNS